MCGQPVVLIRNITSTTEVGEFIQVLFIGRMVKYDKGTVATVRETILGSEQTLAGDW
jgi:hypothetical protein